MEPAKQKPKLVAIVGPTASGKSGLALKIAQQFNGEIIAADSRTIYKGMDIGTAKPTKKEQQMVPHWGLDLVEPGQTYSAYQFKNYANQKIAEIQKCGKLPILVGGTGLYIDAVLFDFDFVDVKSAHEREELEGLSTGQLQELITQKGYQMPGNHQNKRHLIRTIERKGRLGAKSGLRVDVLVTGLMPADEQLRKRIHERAEHYLKKGLLSETEGLLKGYSEEVLEKTQGIAYIAAIKMLKDEINQQQAQEMIQKKEWQYARRQRTWFRRNKFIHWYSSAEQAYKEISSILNN
jgi:tRNA dimethylallyltransferase